MVRRGREEARRSDPAIAPTKRLICNALTKILLALLSAPSVLSPAIRLVVAVNMKARRRAE